MAWALSDAITEILNDSEITDKKGEILRNVDQFRIAVEGYSFSDDADVTVSKNKNKDVDMTKNTESKDGDEGIKVIDQARNKQSFVVRAEIRINPPVGEYCLRVKEIN
jgi:hypothetical protein